jgi:hypothetical protein
VRDDRLLILTAEHYVPYQQLQAARVVGLTRGCSLATIGIAWTPAGPLRAAGLLQEVRSTSLAAELLLAATMQGPAMPS